MKMSDLTWEIVQTIYPNEPLEQLKTQLKAFGFDDPAKAGLVYEVITKGSKERFNVSTQKLEDVEKPDFWPFEQGQILLAFGHACREPFGMGRKSGKWSVDSEAFGTYAAAVTRSFQVKNADPVFYGWDD
jgi:hypothetical protein